MSAMPSLPTPKIWLASASPRRAQLLTMLGVPFERVASTYQEPEPTPEDHAFPQSYACGLAHFKGLAAHWDGQSSPPNHGDEPQIVISADTVVWHEGTILNKPRDEAEARAMLKKLCGSPPHDSAHRVLTGVSVRRLGALEWAERYEETRVHFAHRSDEWIARYVATGEPMDKAGAYAAQGLGSLLIEKIEGDFFNVVGLPLFLLSEMLRERGVAVEGFWSAQE